MGVKGYRSTYGLISDLFDEKGYKNFSLALLNGLDLLETPGQPQKYEVDSLRLAWLKIAKNNAFGGAKPKDNFFMFLNLGSDEMDACMFGERELAVGKKTYVWLDIEVKSSLRGGVKEEIESALKQQVTRHSEVVMPSFFSDIDCVCVGFLDGEFVSAERQFQGKHSSLDEEEFYSFMTDVSWSDDGLKYIQQITGIGNIRGIIRKIEAGTFVYHVDTSKKLDALEKLTASERFIVCYGEAGSGKSVLATSLFMRHHTDPTNTSRMLVMNQKFYRVLSMEKFYADNGCFFGSDRFLEALTPDSVAIIDEAQRLEPDYLCKVLKKAKCLILFGDERQSFFGNDNLDGPNDIIGDIQSRTGIKGKIFPVKSPKRYDESVAVALESLTKIDAKPKRVESGSRNYSIRVIRDFDEFFDLYNKDDYGRMFIPHGDRETFFSDPRIEKRGIQLLDKDVIDFYAGKKYVGDTFHAISFDVDNNYVYLPNLTLDYLYQKRVLSEDRLTTTDEKKRFLNELNVLFTRGLKSLTVFVPDVAAYLHIMSVLKKSGIL